jgi:polysaccharide export outer membrane protein
MRQTFMKSWPARAIKFSLLLCVVLSGSLPGQASDSNQTDSRPSAAAATSSPAQPDSPSKKAHADDTYIIGEDDVLSINVWKEPDLTRLIPVRSDGKISLPLIGDVQAAGRTPAQLQQDIEADLRSYITEPQVTVIVQEIRSQKFNILGQVNKPGSYPLAAGTTIVDALALAGGFKDFAKKKSVYVLRQNSLGEESRIPFNYQEFIKGKNVSQNIKIKAHDTIVVP